MEVDMLHLLLKCWQVCLFYQTGTLDLVGTFHYTQLSSKAWDANSFHDCFSVFFQLFIFSVLNVL